MRLRESCQRPRMVDGTAVLFAGIESTAETAGEESLFERVRRLTLRGATSTQHHHFVADDASLLDSTLVDSQRLLSARQVTDVYLLALAVAHGMRFVTLDRSVSPNAVLGADETSLVVL